MNAAEPPRPAPATGSPTTVPANVTASLAAAQQALDHLQNSLRHAGFAEGVAAYEQMAEILLTQQLLHGRGDPVLGLAFARLGETAQLVFGLLHPYATVMLRLATLAPETPDEVPVTEIVLSELVRRGRRGASAQLLTRTTGLPPTVLESALRTLVNDGRVAARGLGNPPLFLATSEETRTRTPRRAPARTPIARGGQP